VFRTLMQADTAQIWLVLVQIWACPGADVGLRLEATGLNVIEHSSDTAAADPVLAHVCV
jgi:hypothetical protein